MTLLDCLNPVLKHDSLFGDSDIFFSNLRLPIFLIALGIVILYQVKQRRKESDDAEDDDNLSIAQKIARKAGGKLTAQARADLAQIEAMEKSIRGMSQGLGGDDSD